MSFLPDRSHDGQPTTVTMADVMKRAEGPRHKLAHPQPTHLHLHPDYESEVEMPETAEESE